MAEVENVSLVTAAAPAVAVTATAPLLTAADAAVSPKGANGKNIGDGQAGVDGVRAESNTTSNDLGSSPTQEKSSNSHPHDSEYDTASDLENGEEYDDDEDDVDDSLSDEDDDEETETDDDEEEDDEGVDGDMTPQEKFDAEAKKKVDEDRSNPQYIPKRGTFYEHDDRTAEVEGEVEEGEGGDDSECQIVGNGSTIGNAMGTKSTSTPTISSASKTMKKWQPASAVDRWSHDRFDPSEQAPKTRSDLVSAYGYDIRTEDAPPKARRRRRYGRGPSKYNRNWEDESAYLKTNNKERKPPKPSDFPALNDKARKQRRSPVRLIREEKENHMDRRRRGEGRQDRFERQGQDKGNYPDEHNDRRERGEAGYKNSKQKSNFNRPSGQATLGKQAPMEFKQKNRATNSAAGGFNNQSSGSNLNARLEQQRQQTPISNQQNNKGSPNPPNFGPVKNQHQNQNMISQQQHSNDSFNNKKKQDQASTPTAQIAPQMNSSPQLQNAQPQSQSATPPSHNTNRHNSGQLQHKPQIPTSNLSQRLQQVQNRNDPSHVGSVQMHALATQNQQQQQMLQQQQVGNIMMAGPQTNQQPLTQSQEQRGPPKRYSSLRRSQHEAQHMTDHPQLQQLHMQQQAAAPPPTMLMPAEQAMLQANLMQMYHQENLQAQMQALQVTQQPNVPKQPGYVTAPSQGQPGGAYPGTAAPPTAYYVAAPDAYSAATAAQATQAAAAASYAAQQPPPNYLAQQQSAATLAYANSAPNPQQSATAASPFVTAPNVGVVPQSSPAQPAPANYQNYNTVGGTTYFVPPHTQPSSRPVSLPQRRPTNAIPILPPSEKIKSQAGVGQQQKSQDTTKEDFKPTCSTNPFIGSAENIDHIIDNMFVQRPAFQPPPATGATSINSKSTSNEQSTSMSSSNDNSNVLNTSITSSSQDNISASANEKIATDPNTTVATTATSAIGSSTITESSNNNPISTQE